VLRGVLFAVLVVLAVVVGFAAVAGTGRVVARPWVFLTAGGAVFALGGAVSVLVLPARRRRAGLVVVLALAVLGGVVLLAHAPGAAPGTLPGTRWAVERGGARLAYRELPGAGHRHRVPVIFLHGGPGVADMAGDGTYLRRLAAAGWDTYIYDQLGAGRSTRLADPTGYTLARAVADLDLIRRTTGAPRVDLLGYSWGSTLAAAYLAAHPDRVDKVVFASPGPMVGGASDVTSLLGHADTAHVAAVLGQVLPPRPLLTWTLDQANPRAAHAYAADTEMDARFRAISAAAAPALYCHPPASTDGGDVGFYANATLLRRTAWRDPHSALRHLTTPTLVIKGQCDYVSWSSAVDYRDTLPRSRLVYLPGAGHRAYAERPAAFFTTVDAFLTGRPLPTAPYTGTTPPPGYRGPR
jgi:proline iminopeptidase